MSGRSAGTRAGLEYTQHPRGRSTGKGGAEAHNERRVSEAESSSKQTAVAVAEYAGYASGGSDSFIVGPTTNGWRNEKMNSR